MIKDSLKWIIPVVLLLFVSHLWIESNNQLASFQENYVTLYYEYNSLYEECVRQQSYYEKEANDFYRDYGIRVYDGFFDFVDDYENANEYIEPYGADSDTYVEDYLKDSNNYRKSPYKFSSSDDISVVDVVFTFIGFGLLIFAFVLSIVKSRRR